MAYKVIEEGVNLFNDFEFFAAHDFFEDLWMNAGSEEKLFYQGMVQLSVGSYHILNSNFKGAVSQYEKGTAKLKNYVPNYMGIELAILLQKIDNIKKELLENSLSSKYNFDVDKIPKIERL